MPTILITGGTGFIGSHTAVVLLAAGYEVILYDNLSNSRGDVVERIARITGQTPRFVEGDVRDRGQLASVFAGTRIDGVIHFAALKAVGESQREALAYYDVNVGGTLVLCQTMAAAGVFSLVFSSSATVYGDPAALPIREDFARSATNPYGASKLMLEDMLADIAAADPRWRIARLRYFNPIGAHESGLIGESPNGVPNNLLPYVAQVACGKREKLSVFGGDYPTPDGTGVRDYIHVMDLAEGHLAALNRLAVQPGLLTVNLGTGQGYSVLEIVRAFEAASGQAVPLEIVARRPGDIAACYADPSLARELLGWSARRNLDAMCRDAWRWQNNPAAK